MTALEGIRVIELARDVAAGYCGRQFAQWGADVVLFEGKDGSPLRGRHPLIQDKTEQEHSLLWAYVSANKRIVQTAAVESFLKNADILVTDWTADELADIGLSLGEIRKDHPHLSVISILPFGLDGPYSNFQGSELVVQALSGYLSLNGEMGQAPLRAPGHLIGFTIGVNAFVGGLASYVKRTQTGHGDLVEVSGMETLSAIVPFLGTQYKGRDKLREGGTEAGVRMFPTLDGFVCFIPIIARMKSVLSETLDIPEVAWPEDQFEGNHDELINKALSFLSQYTAKMTTEDIFMGLEERGIPCGKLLTPTDLLCDPQLDERGFFHTLNHAQLGDIKVAGSAARMSTLNIEELTQAQVVAAADIDWAERRVETGNGTASALPLEGVKVLDLTQAWIGPYASLLLAELGADVIKIESHKRPDVWRQTSPNPEAIKDIDAALVNSSSNFNSVNLNKWNLCLDLKSEEGKSLFLRLVSESDMVLENYTPKVMDNFGLGYEALRNVKDDIIMTSFCGFGKTGPLADFKTNGSAIEAIAGWDYFHRYEGGDPVEMGFYQADPISGLQMVALTLVSLIHRNRTGEGQALDGAMFEASAGYIGDIIMAASLEGDKVSGGNDDPNTVISGVFPCKGNDRWIAITVHDEPMWQALSSLDGAPQSLSEGTSQELAAWTAGYDADDLMALLQKAGVSAGVVRSVAEGLNDPHLAARNWFKTITHPDMGTHKYNGFPWRFHLSPLKAHLPPPRLGEHSEKILRERLSLSAAEIESLKKRDVTGSIMLRQDQKKVASRY